VVRARPSAARRLYVKAADGADAVLCTDTSTFELQTVETSNTLLLARHMPTADVAASPEDGSGDAGTAEVVGMAGSAFEAKLTPPRIALMHRLLQRSMLTVEDAKAEAMEAGGEEDDDDEAAGSPAKASRKRRRAGDTAAPVTPAGKGDGKAALTPASKAAADEARAMGTATHFTLSDLEACVQASAAEIRAELAAMGTVERDGERGLPGGDGVCPAAVSPGGWDAVRPMG